MDRTILHCDCNGFYASVECILRPELRETPMAVCGDPESRHGIILAKNELAKRYQIQTAETVWQARRKCPGLTLVAPHRDQYQKYSRLVNAIYARYTDQIELFGIDESWLDVTGSRGLFGDGKTIADEIRRVVRAELGLTVSVGVSFNKIFAKLGSDYKKPDATTIISRENFREIVWPLPVTDLLYVGKAAAQILRQVGITTIGELAKADREALSKRLGKMGETLHDYACGLEDSPVRPADEAREMKSVGNGMTYKRNLHGMADIRLGVLTLADEVAARLRRHGMKCRTVVVTIRDPDFKTITRQRPLEKASHLGKELSDAALAIVRELWDLRRPIRMLTITAANLVEDGLETEQLSFFTPQQDEQAREKQEKLENAVDGIRDKFGKSAISRAGVLGNDLGIDRHRELPEGYKGP